MNELYLCPLCAGEALLETVEAHQHTIAKFMPDYPGGAIAQCLKCSLAIMREGPDAVAEVTAAWNTRAELRALGGGETFTMREIVQALTQHYKDTSGDPRHVPATIAAVETMQSLRRIIEKNLDEAPSPAATVEG